MYFVLFSLLSPRPPPACFWQMRPLILFESIHKHLVSGFNCVDKVVEKLFDWIKSWYQILLKSSCSCGENICDFDWFWISVLSQVLIMCARPIKIWSKLGLTQINYIKGGLLSIVWNYSIFLIVL